MSSPWWKNKLFEIVDRPASHSVITSKWVFKKKRGLSGAVEKYKARIEARGFMQQEGIDYTETYSPTVCSESIRLMTAVAAAEGNADGANGRHYRIRVCRAGGGGLPGDPGGDVWSLENSSTF